jgi:hypothetical protein
MGSDRSSASSPARSTAKRTLVEDETGRRPFMRGIMVHSLMSRGVSFDDAYRVANAVREKIRGRGVVIPKDLVQAAREFLGAPEAPEEFPPVRQPQPILVTGAGKEAPFSKGLFSQSLLADAIEPSDAFDVAREIERELLRRGAPRSLDPSFDASPSKPWSGRRTSAPHSATWRGAGTGTRRSR